ncbi:VTT domain-containing protein [Paenibacillus sp. CC-CFT747]|nr:VTT domain-containing protein [Paenibacillus sp. CC-CFT747]
MHNVRRYPGRGRLAHLFSFLHPDRSPVNARQHAGFVGGPSSSRALCAFSRYARGFYPDPCPDRSFYASGRGECSCLRTCPRSYHQLHDGLYRGRCRFFFARYYGHSWVEKKLDRYPAVLEFNKRLETHGFFYVLVGRLIPILPSTAINLGAGVSKIRVSHFILATLIGKLPIVYLESTIAHDMLHIHKHKGRLVLYVVIFLVLLYIGSLFKSKITGKFNSPKK